jgi:hypothetical protein
MARSYAKILVSVWDEDSDFDDLSMQAQWLYWVLCSHPLLSPAGVLPLQPRKWAKRANDAIVDGILDALAELVAARKLIVDDDTEEVLVRTFVRHDGGARNPNIHKAIVSAIGRIESRRLREAATAELARATTKDQDTRSDEHRPEDHPSDPPEPPDERDTESTCHLHLPPDACDPSSTYGSKSDQTLPNEEEDDPRVAPAVEAIVNQRLNGRALGEKPAYRTATEANVRSDHLVELRRLAAKYPTAPADVLAASAQGDKHSLTHYAEGTPA